MATLNVDPSKKFNNSYFDAMLRRYPDVPNFVTMITPQQIQRSAKERIFREMVRGQIDYEEHGQYFSDSKFLENLIVAANDELNSKIVIRQALTFYDMTFPGQQSVIVERARHENLAFVYQTILDRLNYVKMTNNIGYLTDIQYVLNGYRNII